MLARTTALFLFFTFFTAASLCGVAARAAVDASTLTEPLLSGKEIAGASAVGSGLESFKTDLFTGTASFGVPIRVPPGTGGMHPALELRYSSAAGIGWVGFGWTLDLGSVRRSTKRGPPRYDASDEFVLGSDDLVAGEDGFYHTAHESFHRVSYDGPGDYWTVTAPSGKKMLYGSDAQGSRSKVERPEGGTYAWQLDRIIDTHGNSLRVYYDDSDPGILYPRRIVYTFHDGEIVGGEREILFCLEGDAACDSEAAGPPERPDPQINLLPGFPVEMRRRLRVVRVSLLGEIVRRIRIDYHPAGDAGRFRSLVSRIVEIGPGGETLPPLEFEYTTSAGAFSEGETWRNTSGLSSNGGYRGIRPLNAGDASAALMDMNGDGVADRVALDPDDPNYWHVFLRTAARDGFGERGDGEEYIHWLNPSYAEKGRWRKIRAGGGKTKADLVDLNGDGRPDRVIRPGEKVCLPGEEPGLCSGSGSIYWKVFMNNGRGFEPSYTAWLNMSSQHNGNCTFIQAGGGCAIFDIDGDGLPDRVIKSKNLGVDPRYWKVFRNTGAGFEPSPILWRNPSQDDQSRFEKIFDFDNNGDTLAGIFDVNGDGLADRVTVSCGATCEALGADWLVYMNNGRGFEPARVWRNPSGSPKIRDIESSSGDVRADVFDVNGDGLPDRVRCVSGGCSGGSGAWRVHLNSGSGFIGDSTDYIEWENPSGAAGSFPEVRDFVAGLTTADVIDLDGDGMPDRVTCGDASCSGSNWMIYRGIGPRPDLLSKIRNGLGGRIGIEYAPSTFYMRPDLASGRDRLANPGCPFPMETVHRVVRDDGRGLPDSEIATTYYFEGCSYDAEEREFRGFSYVEAASPAVVYPTGKTVRPVRALRFHQEAALKGRPYEWSLYDVPPAGLEGGETASMRPKVTLLDPPLESEFVDHVAQDPADATRFVGASGEEYVSAGEGIFITHPVRVRRAEYDSDGVEARSILSEFRYDAWGNAVEERYLGDEALEGEDEDGFVRRKAYGVNEDAWILNLPWRLDLESPGGELLRRRWVYYDGSGEAGAMPVRGDPTRIVLWWDFPGNAGGDPNHVSPDDPPLANLFYSAVYDAYGNILTLREQGELALAFEYDDGDPATLFDGLRLFPVRETNAKGHAHRYRIDPVTGRVTEQVGPNGTRWRTAYDPFGRKAGEYVQAPGKSEITLATYQYMFISDPGSDANAVVMLRNAEHDSGPGERIVATANLDGLGRVFRAEIEDAGGTPVVQEVAFDRQGRPWYESMPYLSGIESPAYRGLEFGARGDLEREILPDGVTIERGRAGRSREISVWSADGSVAHRSVREVNGFGRVIAVAEFETPEGTPTAVTRYRYDAAGEIVAVLDPLAEGGQGDGRRHVTAIGRDSLGRRTFIEDPDAGRRDFIYDERGDTVALVDARGEALRVGYDVLHRPTEVTGPAAGDPVVELFWDDPAANAVGRLSRAVSLASRGGPVLLEDCFAYGETGALDSERRSIDGWVFITEYGYDLLGRTREVRYPDGERVSFDFRSGLHLRAIRREMRGLGETLLRSASYDGRSRPTRYLLGGKESEEPRFSVERSYDPASGRLESYRIEEGGSGDLLVSLDYGHNALGFVASIDDHLEPARSKSFGYDGLGRLVSATGPYGAGGARETIAYGYDAIGNLIARGNGIRYLFDEGGGLSPHAPDRLARSGGTVALAYDANGSLIRKGARAFVYGGLGKLRRVEEDGVALAEYLYDFLGRKAKSEGPAGVSYYAGPGFYWDTSSRLALKQISHGGKVFATVRTLFEGRSDALPAEPASLLPPLRGVVGRAFAAFYLWVPVVVVVLFRRRIRRGAVPLVSRVRRGLVWTVAAAFVLQSLPVRADCIMPDPPGIVRYHFDDHRGDTILIASASGVVVERLDHSPFGDEILGEGGTVRDGPRFGGKEPDEVTGLYDFGSRWYDPELARFVTPDRKVPDPLNPQSLNRYAYALNNPLNIVDPAGDFFVPLIGVLVAVISTAASAAVSAATATVAFAGQALSSVSGLLNSLGGSFAIQGPGLQASASANASISLSGISIEAAGAIGVGDVALAAGIGGSASGLFGASLLGAAASAPFVFGAGGGPSPARPHLPGLRAASTAGGPEGDPPHPRGDPGRRDFGLPPLPPGLPPFDPDDFDLDGIDVAGLDPKVLKCIEEARRRLAQCIMHFSGILFVPELLVAWACRRVGGGVGAKACRRIVRKVLNRPAAAAYAACLDRYRREVRRCLERAGQER